MYYTIYLSLLFWLMPHVLTDIRSWDFYSDEQTHDNRMELECSVQRILPDLYFRRAMLICGSCDTVASLFD